MIEGQPQPWLLSAITIWKFSGLVIEGQPQLISVGGTTSTEFSGLVIEGQPQLSEPTQSDRH